MTEQDTIQMMQRCREEINLLRNRLLVIEPKAEAYDQLKAVIGMFPQPEKRFGEDLVWMLDQEIERLSAKKPKEK